MMLTIPDLPMITSWLTELSIDSYQCGYCNALHLSHLKKVDHVFDAKVELIDEVIFFVITTEIRASAITSLLTELSQINLSSTFVKVYLEIADDSSPKMVFRHTVDCKEGITRAQFSAFLTCVEDEALQIISELNSYELLSEQDSLADDLTEAMTKTTTYH